VGRTLRLFVATGAAMAVLVAGVPAVAAASQRTEAASSALSAPNPGPCAASATQCGPAAPSSLVGVLVGLALAAFTAWEILRRGPGFVTRRPMSMSGVLPAGVREPVLRPPQKVS
jgi:hypothetical protein